MEEMYLNARDFGATGSTFETTAQAVAGEASLILADVGDFEAGNEVILVGCHVSYPSPTLHQQRDLSPINPRPWKHRQPLDGRVELRGYDGSQGAWVVYFIDISPKEPGVFRWTKDYGRHWEENVPLTEGWIELGDGVSIKINDFVEREWGATAVIVCSAQLVTTIERIEGNRMFVADCPNLTAECRVLHADSAALQRAIDAAIERKTSLFVPNGRYRLADTLKIVDASAFTFLGESGCDTILDNSFDRVGVESYHGSCFYLEGGTEVNIKNVFMVGNLGFADRDQGANLLCHGGTSVFAFYYHKTNASCVRDTQRVLFENCHARKMSAECFYSMGHTRESELPHEWADPPEKYTRSITYLRCSVEDCARNAFNNNDKAEGTSILYCRVKDVGNAMNEGASRFLKIHGCYVCNTGPIEMGNIRRRGHLERMGAAQHIITNNYFEGRTSNPVWAMIGIGSYASQVIVANNTFINFSSPAIRVSGPGQNCDTPAENVIITGNSIDLTPVDEPSRPRYGVQILSNFVTVADNHIFVRGEADENVTGIEISDNAVRVSVHDNTITACGVGIRSTLATGAVGRVASDTVFYRKGYTPMLLRKVSHRYRGWHLLWTATGEESEILDFDPEALTFTLKEPRAMQVGDEFILYGPKALPWSVHHNVIDSCTVPMDMDTYAGRRAQLDGNIIGE
ncbi:MAG: hypothetical protein E7541_01170 [Ruminococcaceae bacterium]|nr:hypothetical protein [Oscillospiraceae bacterium]